LLSGFLLVTCATEPETRDIHWQADQMCQGIKQMANGYSKMIKAEEEIENNRVATAQIHIEKAENYFSKAVAYFAKAELIGDDKVIEELDNGIKALKNSNRELDRGNTARADDYVIEAGDHFERVLKALSY
jgi:transcriptional regulator with GAF, ATPase, and Fis domain